MFQKAVNYINYICGFEKKDILPQKYLPGRMYSILSFSEEPTILVEVRK